jgi:hypothetical protein
MHRRPPIHNRIELVFLALGILIVAGFVVAAIFFNH